MSDDADRASQIEEDNLAVILANRPKTTTGVSAVDCEECGDPIEEKRRIALPGIQTCCFCAQLNEDKGKFKMGRVR